MFSHPSRLLLIYVIALFIPGGVRTAIACIWYEGTTLEGRFTRTGPVDLISGNALVAEEEILSPKWDTDRFYANKYNAVTLRAIMSANPTEFLELNQRTLKNAHPDWPQGMDDAVRLIFSGDASGSRTQLEALAQRHPDNYWICANLAAACELSGDLPSAQQWVEKALTINPQAHEGTEWMHAAVIRARLALEKDASWLQSHTISGVPMDVVPKGFTLNDGRRTLSLEDIHRALMAHTFARLLFVKPKDPVAASLLTELAQVEARLFSIESGNAMLDLAEEYGAPTAAAIREKWAAMGPGPLERWFRSLSPGWIFLIMISVPTVVVLALWRVYRRRKNARKATCGPV